MNTLLSRFRLGAVGLFTAIVVAVASLAPAQWGTQIPNDTVNRPVNGPTFLLSQDAATTTSITSAGVLVNAYSIATGTSVASASITNPLNPRTLSILVKENSGTAIRGYLVIQGRNQFGRFCSSRVEMGTAALSSRYAQTGIAYRFITSIDYSGLTGTAASDILSVSPGQRYGLPYRSSSGQTGAPATALLQFVVALTSTGAVQTPANNAGTWSVPYSTFTPASALTVPAFLTVYGFSDRVDEASQTETVTAGATF